MMSDSKVNEAIGVTILALKAANRAEDEWQIDIAIGQLVGYLSVLGIVDPGLLLFEEDDQ
jgi:hypothetical protein